MREDNELFVAVACHIGDAEPVSGSSIGDYCLFPEQRVTIRCFRESGLARDRPSRLRKDEKLPDGCCRRHSREFLRAANHELWDAIAR